MIEILIRVGASLFLAVALGAAFGVLVGILSRSQPDTLWPDGQAEKRPPRWPPVPTTQKHVDERVRLYMAAKTGMRS